MYHPIREGTRGGQGLFSWAQVSADKDREHYLGHSVNAPTGRWQKSQDVHWYNREKKQSDKEKAEELRMIKEAEADAIAVALGFKPNPKNPDAPPPSRGSNPNPNMIPLEGGRSKHIDNISVVEVDRRESKDERGARKEARRAEREERRLRHEKEREDRYHHSRHRYREHREDDEPIRDRHHRDRRSDLEYKRDHDHVRVRDPGRDRNRIHGQPDDSGPGGSSRHDSTELARRRHEKSTDDKHNHRGRERDSNISPEFERHVRQRTPLDELLLRDSRSIKGTVSGDRRRSRSRTPPSNYHRRGRRRSESPAPRYSRSASPLPRKRSSRNREDF